MRFVLLKRKMGFKDTISQGFIKQLAAHGLCEVSAHGIFKNHGIYPQFPRRKSCWVQLGTRLPGNQSHSRSRALRNPGLTMQEAGREINQQPFVNCFGFSCAGPGDFLLGKGKRFQTPLSADKAALLCLNPVILSTKAPLMLHLISLTWFSLGIPQITPLQIQALIPCASEVWEEIVFLLTPNHLNERFFLESEASPPTTLQSCSSHSRFLLLTHIFDSFHEKKKKKKRIGIGSHMFQRQLEQLRVQPCIPHAPKSEIKSLESLAHDWGEKFSSLSHVYTNNLPPSPPRNRELQLPAGMTGLGLKESRIRARTWHEVGGKKINLAEITGLELLQRSQIAAVDGMSCEQRRDLRMGNEHLGF